MYVCIYMLISPFIYLLCISPFIQVCSCLSTSLFVYVILMCVCIHNYIHRIHTYLRTSMHTHTHIYIYAYTRIYTYTYTYTYIYIHIYLHLRTHIHIHIYICVRLQLCEGPLHSRITTCSLLRCGFTRAEPRTPPAFCKGISIQVFIPRSVLESPISKPQISLRLTVFHDLEPTPGVGCRSGRLLPRSKSLG